MTHTTVVDRQGVAGNERYIEATVTISSYPTGGEALTDLSDQFAAVGMCLPVCGGSAGYFFIWIPSTKKLKMMTATGTEVTASTNVGIVYVRMTGV